MRLEKTAHLQQGVKLVANVVAMKQKHVEQEAILRNYVVRVDEHVNVALLQGDENGNFDISVNSRDS